MKSTAMALAVLATSVTLTAMFMAGDACENLPTTSWSDACLKVSTTPSMYNVCQEALQHAPDTAEATVYAAAAATAAKDSYGATTNAAEDLLLFGSLSADERAAVELCLYKTAMVSGRMSDVADNMNICKFEGTEEAYNYSVWAVESCREALSPFPSSPLVAMNAADQAVTNVAVHLGSLVLE